MNEDIFTHSCKLDNISKDLNEACNKYDKFFIENLSLPGIIGEGSKYKNMRDYIDVIYILKLFRKTSGKFQHS